MWDLLTFGARNTALLAWWCLVFSTLTMVAGVPAAGPLRAAAAANAFAALFLVLLSNGLAVALVVLVVRFKQSAAALSS